MRSISILSAMALVGWAQEPTKSNDLTELSLEDLMRIPVVSVARKAQPLSRAAAAIYVITQEEIRRSGATNIPDLLRMAPGVEVAQVNSNRWAISIRGFNSVFANKVLLLVDGRSVYNSVSSSVFWDWEQIPLPDIERIEVIRGPGGTAWGANAMNGVINIITKNSRDTAGGLLRAATGSWQTVDGLVQYGGQAGPRASYRVFGRYFNVESGSNADGTGAADGWHGAHGGFRADLRLSSADTFMLEGNLLETAAGQTITSVFSNALPLIAITDDRLTNTSGDLLGRWDHAYSDTSQTRLEVSYDRDHRDARAQMNESHETAELDFQHHLTVGSRNDLVWGLGYRYESSDMRPSYATAVIPAMGSTHLYSAFLQDEIELAPSLFFTLGSKFEHNDYTGFEYEPSVQLLWAPSSHHTLWASAARAIRQPSRVDFGIVNSVAIVPLSGGFGAVTVFGSPTFRPEQVRDYEAGYRSQLSNRLSLDLAAFWSFYRDLRTSEPRPPYFTLSPGPPHMVFPVVFGNLAHGRTRGAELYVNWEVNRRWRLSPGYWFLLMNVQRDPGSGDAMVEQMAGYSPQHHAQIRSFFDLRRNLDFDATLQYVSRLSSVNVPAYVRLDARLSWRPRDRLEFSIAGENLGQPRHAEFFQMWGIHAAMISRSMTATASWRF